MLDGQTPSGPNNLRKSRVVRAQDVAGEKLTHHDIVGKVDVELGRRNIDIRTLRHEVLVHCLGHKRDADGRVRRIGGLRSKGGARREILRRHHDGHGTDRRADGRRHYIDHDDAGRQGQQHAQEHEGAATTATGARLTHLGGHARVPPSSLSAPAIPAGVTLAWRYSGRTGRAPQAAWRPSRRRRGANLNQGLHERGTWALWSATVTVRVASVKAPQPRTRYTKR